MTERHPAIRHFRRVAGEAGHVSYFVEVQTTDGDPRQLAFTGNIFVGPVVVTSTDTDGRRDHEIIDHPRRFGEFVSSEWVHRFLESWTDEQAA